MSLCLRNRYATPLFTLFALGLATAQVNAQVYTSQAAFQAALQAGYYFEPMANTTTDTFSGGSAPFGYTVSAPNGVYNGPTLIGCLLPNETFSFSFTSGSPNAIGGNYFSTDISDNFQPGVQITLTYSDGFVDTFTPTSVNDFRGYISTVALTGLDVDVPLFSGTDNYTSMNNITVGLAAAVPEPTTVAMIGMSGLVGLYSFRRYRMKHATAMDSKMKKKRV